MDIEQHAEKNAQYSGFYWGVSYFSAFVAMVQQSDNPVKLQQTRTLDGMGIFFSGMALLYCFLPGLAGASCHSVRQNGCLIRGSLKSVFCPGQGPQGYGA